MRVWGLLAAVMLAGIAGCSSIVNEGGDRQRVRIDSVPHGAQVTVDGMPEGVTPTRVMLDRKTQHTVRIDLAGYQSHERTIRSGVAGAFWGNLALFGGAPLGMACDIASGTWRGLSDTDFTVKLVPYGR